MYFKYFKLVSICGQDVIKNQKKKKQILKFSKHFNKMISSYNFAGATKLVVPYAITKFDVHHTWKGLETTIINRCK